MNEDCLGERLGRYAALTTDEKTALAALTIDRRRYRRGERVRAEHGPVGDPMIVEQGWAFCSMLSEDGRRQIIRLHFRGDLLAFDGLAFAEATDTVQAMTDTTLAVLDRAALGRLFTDHPRLGILLLAIAQIDRVMLTDRLVSLGRNSARGRVGALLLWISKRMRDIDPAGDGTIMLPLTQEEIGDATGLTAVHVNRTLRLLSEQGLIVRTNGALRIVDPRRLERIANLAERSERIDPAWLPFR